MKMIPEDGKIRTGFRLEETDIVGGATLKYIEWAGAFYYAPPEDNRENAISLLHEDSGRHSNLRHKGIDHEVVVAEELEYLIDQSILRHDQVQTYRYKHLVSTFQQTLEEKMRSSFEEAVREKLTFTVNVLDRQFKGYDVFAWIPPDEEEDGKVVAFQDRRKATEMIDQYDDTNAGRAKLVTIEQVARKIHRSGEPEGSFGKEEVTFWPEWK